MESTKEKADNFLSNTNLEETYLLMSFKLFCENIERKSSQQKIRNIFYNSTNINLTVYKLFANEMNVVLNEEECKKMVALVTAYLRKSSIRKKITNETKNKLLKTQKCKCAICGEKIDISSHADHIVPFKYVGDELDNNLQMLCSKCNTRKNSNLDYQIMFQLRKI